MLPAVTTLAAVFSLSWILCSVSVSAQDRISLERDGLVNDCGCGVENAGWPQRSRILGGDVLEPAHRFPWTVALIDENNQLLGGGTILSDRHILTAAHCCVEKVSKLIRVIIGAHNISASVPIDIEGCTTHPNYQKQSYAHDIAVVTLKTPIYFHEKASPVCLPRTDALNNVKDMTVVGWGRLKEVSKTSEVLRFATVHPVSNKECQKKLKSDDISDSNICAGGTNQDTCQGDSGGPLLVEATVGGSSRWVQIGIVSWGVGCGRPGLPGIYTKVSEHIDFIQGIVKRFCDPTAHDVRRLPGTPVRDPPVPNVQHCGIANDMYIKSPRIVGGTPLFPRKYPWLAAVLYKGKLSGSGVYIGNGFVLSCAGNFGNNGLKHPETLTVILGGHSIDNSTDSERFTVHSVAVHPKYNHPYFDVALVKLEKQVDENRIRPVCLIHSSEEISPEEIFLVQGWGRIHDNGPFSDVPVETHMNPVPKSECDKSYNGAIDDAVQLCAVGDQRDICDGDGGSPLLRYRHGRFFLTAIASSGSDKGCAHPNTPSVFTRIFTVLNWIRSTTGIA